jgi:hypothetical protein
MTHMFQGTVSLELARQVAKTLHASPALLAIGRDNLENADTPSLLRCYASGGSRRASASMQRHQLEHRRGRLVSVRNARSGSGIGLCLN